MAGRPLCSQPQAMNELGMTVRVCGGGSPGGASQSRSSPHLSIQGRLLALTNARRCAGWALGTENGM